jgi:hypothetical protein
MTKSQRFRRLMRIGAAIIFVAWSLTLPASIATAADKVWARRAQQVPPVCMFKGTLGVSPGFTREVGRLIAEQGGVGGAQCYALTNVKYDRSIKKFRISLAAFSSGEPDKKDWRLDDAMGMLTGEVEWGQDGIMEGAIYGPPPAETTTTDGLIVRKAGSTTGTIFPWGTGTKVRYGEDGIHAGWGGFGDLWGIDFVSWDNISGYADDKVYAAFSGHVTYICRDAHSMALRVGAYLYAHLAVDNNIYENETYYNRGDQIGTLVHGDFDDTCGYADNGDNSHGYHLHFAFPFNNGVFYIGGCALSQQTHNFSCGDLADLNIVQPNEDLTNAGEDGGGGSDPTPDAEVVANFWSYLLHGFNTIVTFITGLFPEHQPFYGVEIVQTAGLIMSVLYEVALTQFNMFWPGVMVTMCLAGEGTRWSIKIYLFIKSLVPGA